MNKYISNTKLKKDSNKYNDMNLTGDILYEI